MTEEDILIPEDNESIKLIKNTKGYNYELKIKEKSINIESIRRSP